MPKPNLKLSKKSIFRKTPKTPQKRVPKTFPFYSVIYDFFINNYNTIILLIIMGSIKILWCYGRNHLLTEFTVNQKEALVEAMCETLSSVQTR